MKDVVENMQMVTPIGVCHALLDVLYVVSGRKAPSQRIALHKLQTESILTTSPASPSGICNLHNRAIVANSDPSRQDLLAVRHDDILAPSS